MNTKFMVKLLTIAFLTSFLSINLFAQKSNEYLKKVEDVINQGNDSTFVMNTILISNDGSEEKRVMKGYRKGDKKIFFFLYPPGVKGVAFLSLEEDQMYLYMPAFKKVRRIASSAKNENFMGTDMSYEDLQESDYAGKYNPRIISESDTEVVLELIKKPDSDATYSRIIMTVDRKTWVRKKSEMYNKAGKLWKKMVGTKIEIVDGYPFLMDMHIKDLISNHATRLIIEEAKFDSGLGDSLFSKRRISRIR